MRVFRASLFACALLGAGVVTAVASYESPVAEQPRPAAAVVNAPARPDGGYVTVEVGGKKLKVNAQTLQQGPLSQEQSQQIADALKDNKSTQGLVEVRHEDGSVSMDLQDRFQNVTLARKNEDGSVSTACVDTPEAAEAFLRAGERTPATGGEGTNRKATLKE
ncbi:MAG: post-PEP-CTERM-1 domain-containing protein [Pyrinomonadaceae bacterium]